MKIRKLMVVILLLMLFAAVLTACGKEFTVTFYANGGTLVSGDEVQTIKKGDGAAAPVYTKEGYTLSWDILFDEIKSDIVVSAVWTPIKYTYIFKDWDNTEITAQTADYGSVINLPANPSKAATAENSFTFTGWSPAVPEVLTGNITFTAQYSQATRQYTYTFYNWHGTELKTQTASYGSTISAPANPSKAATAAETFTFTGWSPAVPDVLTEDIVFTAQYSQAVRQYLYTFYNWDGTELITQTASYGSAINPPNASKAATIAHTFTFAGWNPAVPDSLTTDMFFVAQYTQTARQYTYTFLDWNGTILQSLTADYGSLIYTPSILPSRASTAANTFSFAGWSPTLPYTLLENTVFVAEYTQTPRQYAITFECNGGSTVAPISVLYNTAITEPQSPAKKGYTFGGWYTDIDCKQAYNFATPAVEDIVLYAKWEEGTAGLVYSLINEDTEYCVTSYNGTDNEVYIPSDYKGKPVTSIGEEAFYGRSGLINVVMPDSVTTLGAGAFYWCLGLKSITLSQGLTSLEKQVLYNCYSLTSIVIPNGITKIDDQAFTMCSSLTSVAMSNSLQSIGKWAFYYCNKLESIELPDSLTSIGERAFYDCPLLKSITIAATTPPAFGYNALEGTNSSLLIYVPAESLEAYKTADGWCDYATYIVPLML